MCITGRTARMLAAAAMVAGTACSYETPAPPFANVAVAGVSRADFNAYAAGLSFDTAPGVGDEQRLMLLDSLGNPHYGPLARIQPERGANHLETDDLGEGRIIARLINLDTIGYPKKALAAGDTTYWFVQHGRSWFVPRTTRNAIVSDTLHMHPAGSNGKFPRALARWLWDPNDEQVWGTCTKNRCCYTDP